MDFNAPLAIIGLSCKFAGDASTPEKLWELCAAGKSAWSEIPTKRFNQKGFYHPDGQKCNTLNTQGGHFIEEDVALFDANFFNFTSEVAAATDPQFRMQLETTYEALENAGLSIEGIAGSNTSVFAGSFFHDYNESHARDTEAVNRSLLVGVGSAMAAGRVSHFFDLRGPSMTIDTGCSTTLTAFHQACQSLRCNESDMSIVGASNLMLNPDQFLVMSSAFLSAAGRSYAFDSRASGYGRGEGSAVVIIKRLEDALKDSDPIRAIIRASAANQDGKTESITTPSEQAQATLIRECYEKAGLDPSETTYFEAHGTGTPTGDPIEARAVASVFKKVKTKDNPLIVGSVKTNIGHTETASGLAAIIKVTMALEKGQIPPSINFETPNPRIPFEEYRIKVASGLQPWKALESNGVRRASVNNFGYGGANAHVVLEAYESFKSGHMLTNEAVAASDVNSQPRSRVFTLSAKDEQATLTMAANLLDYLQSRPVQNESDFLDNLAFTLGQRRSVFPWASAQPASSVPALIKALSSSKMAPTRATHAPAIGFVFTGQGAQWWAMGRELIAAYPLFRSSVLECEAHLRQFGCTWDITEELSKSPEATRVNELALSTPLCVIVQISLVRLLASWGVKPVAVTSHSSGEVAAAYAAGALSIRTAMAISYVRGKVAGKAAARVASQKGSMIATGLNAKELQEKYLSRLKSGKVVPACFNSPSSTTASGDVNAVVELEALLQADNIFARRLKIDAAYHSHHMEAVAGPYRDQLQKAFQAEDRKDESVIFSSPTTGKRETSGLLLSSPDHWVNSLVSPVRFIEAFEHMCFEKADSKTTAVNLVIEIGPHAALSGPIQDILGISRFKDVKIAYLSSLVRKSSAVDSMHSLVSELVRSGTRINMNAVNFPFGKPGVSVLHDLPSYPWQHQRRHWSEPRCNRAHRNRQVPEHDLLGSLELGTNLLAPTWRHIVKLTELPWIRDHVVQGSILLPGAGYICMAIEGARQWTTLNGSIANGFALRDIEVLLGLQIPDDSDGIEMQLTLNSCNDKAINLLGWSEFHVYSVTIDGKWTEHCKGLIRVDTSSAKGEPAPWTAPLSAIKQLEKHGFAETYPETITPEEVYDAMREVDIHHGPIFQNLNMIRTHGDQSFSEMTIADSAATQPYRHQSNHVIHPTTLDTLFQAAFAGYMGVPEPNWDASFVPRSIKGLYISSKIPSEAGHKLKTYCDLNSYSAIRFDADLTLVDHSADRTTEEPLLKIESYAVQSLGNKLSQSSDAYEKLAAIQWLPDVSLLDMDRLRDSMKFDLDLSVIDKATDLRRACLGFINDAIAELRVYDISRFRREHKKYYVWMKLQQHLAETNQLASNSSSWSVDTPQEKKALVARMRATSPNGEVICTMGAALPAMLRGEVTPTDILLQDGLLQKFQLKIPGTERSLRQVEELVRLFIHKSPKAKIIEVGGGFANATRSVLKVLGKDDSGVGPLAASYDFTDVSPDVVSAAEDSFAEWGNLVRVRQLDISKDPASQGFENGSYDLVIASQAMSATGDATNNMLNVRRLLRPGGKLLLVETTKDRLDLSLVFGMLPEWWHPEDQGRAAGPFLSVETWDRVLLDKGFSGVELDLSDCTDERFQSSSVMWSIAMDESNSQYNFDTVIVTSEQAPPSAWTDDLSSQIAGVTGKLPEVQSLHSATFDGKLCIFVDDIDSSVLRAPSPTAFEAVKSLCVGAKGLLWITSGSVCDCESPDASLAQGFLRVLRAEHAGKRAILFDQDPQKDRWTPATVQSLTSLFKKCFDYSSHGTITDFEFAERDGIFNIPRFYKDAARNQVVFPNPTKPARPQRLPFRQSGRELRLTMGFPGRLDSVAFKTQASVPYELPEDHIEVEPSAFGVNARDVRIATGQLVNENFGFECAGTVKRSGHLAAAQGFKEGDRVTTLVPGQCGTSIAVPWTNAVHIPNELSFEIAAALPIAYTTAYVALVDTARLQTGDKILIHTAAGAVGQAAIALARVLGAQVFATAGTCEKRRFLSETFGIPNGHIFSSRDTSFARELSVATGGKGVDVVLNTLSGELLAKSLDCVAQFGRFVDLAKLDSESSNHLDMTAFARQVSFFSLDLHQMQIHRGEVVSRAMKKMMSLQSLDHIAAAEPIAMYEPSDIEKALRLVQSGKHTGKVVITTNDTDEVQILPERLETTLRADVSYLLVGGIGGIGKTACHWMVEHGARNLIVMSRSANKAKVRPFIDELAAQGCKVFAIACDVGDSNALAKALDICSQNMPPIRGIVQGAAALQDSFMEKMTVEQFTSGIRPKVDGSWNIHKHFSKSKDLDFYVMLSSLSGVVGLATQCNYAAGNAYQDALARHRLKQGLPAVAIDLGAVKAVGIVANNKEIEDNIKRSGYTLLTEDHVMAALNSAIVSPPKEPMLIGFDGVDWEASGLIRDERFAPLRPQTSSRDQAGSGGKAGGELTSLISAAGTVEEAESHIVQAILNKLVDIFMIDEAEVDESRPPKDYGVDSLSAVELRTMLALRAGSEVSIFDIMQSSSIIALAHKVALASSFLPATLAEACQLG